MRTPREIYEAYRTMPSLDTHQLRVASVAKMICDSFDGPLDARSIILTCLFHDMGNIIKADLDYFPDLFRDTEEREYWKKVKQEYIEKYGVSEHYAALAITEELGLPEVVRRYIAGIGFSNVKTTSDSGSFEEKICEYADLRVGPRGILSLDGRITDIHTRYAGRHHAAVPDDENEFNELKQAAFEMQDQVFTKCSITPEDINDESVAPIVEELRDYQVLQ
jgi:hypothetical protein